MSKVSIIIPTYNRPNCLQRILGYYYIYGRDINVIVADSSSDENKNLNKKIISLFPNLKINYLGNYPTEIYLPQKLADALNYVESKYCLFCADDDFITPKGIDLAVDFLEHNPDFIVAHGQYIGFYLKTKKNGEKWFCWKWLYSPQSIIFQDPAARLKVYLANYSLPNMYGVYRTDSLKMIFGEFLKSRVEHSRLSELLLAMLAIIYGKMKYLDVLYSARSEPLLSVGEKVKAHQDYLNYVRNTIYDEEYIKFKNCLATHLSKVFSIDLKESKKIIDDAAAIYFKKDYPQDFRRFLRDKIIRDIFYYLNLPNSFYEKIRSFYLRRKSNFPGPSSKYYDDFNKIKNCVISHTKLYEK